MPDVVSVLSGRPHLIKAAAVHAGLPPGVSHHLLDLKLAWSKPDRRTQASLGLSELTWHDPGTKLEGGYWNHHAVSFAKETLARLAPKLVLVYGDLDGSLAGAIGARVAGLRVVHIEAGLRNGPLGDFEQHNRVAIDSMADLFTTHLESAVDTLLADGAAREDIHLGVNPITALLDLHLSSVDASREPQDYILATLHRLEALESPAAVKDVFGALRSISEHAPVKLLAYGGLKRAAQARLDELPDSPGRVDAVEPTDYLDYLRLVSDARAVVSDSSGVFDEAVHLGKPVVVLRHDSHRIEGHTDSVRLAGLTHECIVRAYRLIEDARAPRESQPTISKRSDVASAGLRELGGFLMERA